MAEIKFEEVLKKLEKIVEALEEGNLGLEDALKKYEEGIKLVRHCSQRLDQAQKKIKVLEKDKDGKMTLRDFKEEG